MGRRQVLSLQKNTHRRKGRHIDLPKDNGEKGAQACLGRTPRRKRKCAAASFKKRNVFMHGKRQVFKSYGAHNGNGRSFSAQCFLPGFPKSKGKKCKAASDTRALRRFCFKVRARRLLLRQFFFAVCSFLFAWQCVCGVRGQ